MRPRRKFELGSKIIKPKGSERIATEGKNNTTPSSTTLTVPSVTPNTEAFESEEVGDSTTTAIPSPTTEIPFIPTARTATTTHVVKGSSKFKVPFSFKGPLKPKLVSFSIEKPKKKKSPPKFATKVNKQISDKLKELRGFNKDTAESTTLTTAPKNLQNKQVTANLKDGLTKEDTTAKANQLEHKVENQSKETRIQSKKELLKQKLKLGRKLFGSKVKFLKAGYKKTSALPISVKPPKSLPSKSSTDTTSHHHKPSSRNQHVDSINKVTLLS